jgi:hypothetical protein
MDVSKDLPDDQVVKVMNPAMFVHIDQSYHGAGIILEDNISPEELEKLSKTRWGIINVWRAMEPVRREPLAVCDARSVAEEDLRPIKAVLPNKAAGNILGNVSKSRDQELFNVAYNPGHQWYYKSGMGPEDVLLIKYVQT